MILPANASPSAPRNASRTARSVASLRAFHRLMDGEPKLLDDGIAEKLLDAEVLARICARDARFETPGMRALRVRVALRSRFAEARLERAAERGVRQCVVLGAGFDTFAYRQPSWATDMRLFEVDHRATQALKRARLDAAGIAVPDNLEFVTIDFERVSLREGLATSSLDFARPAFFSCLGVLMYLTREAVDAVFDLVAQFPGGSEIAFTFVGADALETDVASRLGAAGEPWLTHLDAETLADDLSARGFSSVTFLDLEETRRTCFRDRTDGLELPQRMGIAAATV